MSGGLALIARGREESIRSAAMNSGTAPGLRARALSHWTITERLPRPSPRRPTDLVLVHPGSWRDALSMLASTLKEQSSVGARVLLPPLPRRSRSLGERDSGDAVARDGLRNRGAALGVDLFAELPQRIRKDRIDGADFLHGAGASLRKGRDRIRESLVAEEQAVLVLGEEQRQLERA
jgi:hypothetical protein